MEWVNQRSSLRVHIRAGAAAWPRFSECLRLYQRLLITLRIPQLGSNWVSAKPGLWTGLDWTVDWTGLDWTVDWTGLDCGLDWTENSTHVWASLARATPVWKNRGLVTALHTTSSDRQNLDGSRE